MKCKQCFSTSVYCTRTKANEWYCFHCNLKFIIKKSVKDLFKQFLREQGAYDAFINNWERFIICSSSWRCSWDFLNNPYDYLIEAFFWGSTPEQKDYWAIIHRRWVSLLEEKGVK